MPGPLGPREIQALRAIAADQSIADIARTMHVSKETARQYIRRVLAKLDAPTREDAVRTGRQLGYVTDACPTCGR